MLKDFVVETASSPGTSADVELLGVPAGLAVRTFDSVFGSGDPVFYKITDGTAQSETGMGVFTSPNTLTRTTVLANTAGTTSRLNFTGTVYVTCDLPASQVLFINSDGDISALGTIRELTSVISSGSIIVTEGSTSVTLTEEGSANFLQTGSSGTFVQFQVNAVGTVGSITGNGSTGVLYNTTSDAELKIDDGLVGDVGAIVDALEVHMFRWLSDPEASAEMGFFAQQVKQHFPWAVTEGTGTPGEPGYKPWQIDKSSLTPLLMAVCQSLRGQVSVLETRVAALEAKG